MAKRKPAKNVSATKQKMLWFRIALVVFPVLLLVLFELLLRMADYGGPLDLFVETEQNGKACFTINKQIGEKYFSSKDIAIPDPYSESFAKVKDRGTIRVFCLGGSSTVGFPYTFTGTFPSFLQDRLSAQFPDYKFEVINLGMAAVMSYTVADFVPQVLKHEPDLLIVYMGHNEFYGALGSGSAIRMAGGKKLVETYLWLHRFKTFRLLRDFISNISSLTWSTPAISRGQHQTLMQKMAAERAIPIESELYAQTLDIYRENYRDIIALARQSDVPVMIATTASNIKDLPPFVSLFSDTLSDTLLEQWQTLFEQASAAYERAKFSEALTLLERAAMIDESPAKLPFLRGRILMAQNELQQAKQAFERARDLDGLRFRASSDLNGIVRSLAAPDLAYLVDIEQIFSDVSPEGIAGDELFFEHVHPRAKGYFLIAKELAEGIRQNSLLFAAEKWAGAHTIADSFLLAASGVSELDEMIAENSIAILKSKWPFSSGMDFPEFPRDTRLQALASDVATQKLTWRTAHTEMAAIYQQSGQSALAVNELIALAKSTPGSDHYWIQAADIAANASMLHIAEYAYRRAMVVNAKPNTVLKLASLYTSAASFQQARDLLQQAGEAAQFNDAERGIYHYLFAASLANTGDLDAAVGEIERAITCEPRNGDYLALKQQLLAALQR